MDLKRLRLASSRCSAGELTLGELGSTLWERDESPLVNKLGLLAIVSGYHTLCVRECVYMCGYVSRTMRVVVGEERDRCPKDVVDVGNGFGDRGSWVFVCMPTGQIR